MAKNFYITTTLPYVNAAPHIGFALEILAADMIARYHREILAENVIFNTGTDEHGQKIWQAAQKEKLSPQAYCDRYAAKFSELKTLLNLSVDHFIRTSDENHIKAAQAFWQKCFDNGDIYKAKYPVKYCIGCEMAKTESELVAGRCPLHPKIDLEIREEENYFFRFSAYAQKLSDFYQAQKDFVKPSVRYNEIKAFVKGGLTDFSISRLKEKMPWGVAVPGDSEHVMYVWFDALVNYISTLGWPENSEQFENFWPAIQVAGKDNLRQQAAMWQAMLMSANLANSKQVLINGFIGVDGQKMSKSLGNVISPDAMVERYGIDASRYLLISLGAFAEDMDVSFEKLDLSYNAQLANGLGNLCSRVAKMASSENLSLADYQAKTPAGFQAAMDENELNLALSVIENEISRLDKYLAKEKPWKLSGQAKSQVLTDAAQAILDLALALQILMPETAKQIQEKFSGQTISAFETGLFPRLS